MPTEETTSSGGGDVPERFAVDFTGLTLLGTYVVRAKLADGGMGSVYVGDDTNLGRRVVIKVPHVRFLGEADFRRRFKREIDELVRLEHPHIVRILAQGEHDGVPFFVLQYLGGGSLEDVFEAREGRFALSEVMPWLETIGRTLDFVHERGTVHRDVKPANVLFDDGGNVFLSDFGVSKALEEHEANLTEAGTGVGSPKYMAPEQTVGGLLTPAADVYALASMTYEALGGRPPFQADTMIDLLIEKKTKDAPRLTEVVPDADPRVADVLARALERDPAARHGSCGDFVEALRQAGAPPAAARAASSPSRVRLGPLAWTAGALLILGGAIALLGAGGTSGPQSGPTDQVETVRITVKNPGAEPRRALRFVPDPGKAELIDIVIAQHNVSSTLPQPAYKEPKQTFKMRVETEDAAAGGDTRMRWRVLDVLIDYDPGTPAIVVELGKKHVPYYVGLEGTTVLTPNGLPRSAEIVPPKEAPEMIRRQYETLSWIMRGLAVPFPVAPVGAGAEWLVTATGQFLGLDLTYATTCHLRELTAHTAHLEMFSAQSAPRQDIVIGGDTTATVKWFQGSGEGSAVTRFDRVVPEKALNRVEIKMHLVIQGLEEQLRQAREPGAEVPDAASEVDMTTHLQVQLRHAGTQPRDAAPTPEDPPSR